MHPHRVEILDRANDDAVVVPVANDLHLEFLPADDRLFQQNFRRRRHLEAVRDDALEFLAVIGNAAAGTAERERGTDNRREADPLLFFQRLIQRMRNLRARALQAYLGHGHAEQVPIFGRIDRFARGRNHLDTVFLENALAREIERAVEAGLAAHCRQERIRPLLLDDAGQRRPVNGLDVSSIGHLGVCHDRRRVGIDQDHAIALLAERFARLRPRVIELAGLPDHDRPCADDQDAFNICASGHRDLLELS